MYVIIYRLDEVERLQPINISRMWPGSELAMMEAVDEAKENSAYIMPRGDLRSGQVRGLEG